MPAPVRISSRCSGSSARSSSTSGRIASWPRSMMERPPIFTTCSQGKSLIGRVPATGRVRLPSRSVWRASGEATCLIWLVSGMAMFSSARGDDGADMFAGERAGQVAGNEAVDDLHLVDVTRRGQEIEHGEFEDGVLEPIGLHLGHRDLRDESSFLRGLRVCRIEAVLVLHIYHGLAAELLGNEEAPGIGAVRWN